MIVVTITPPREMDGEQFAIFVLQTLYDEPADAAAQRLEDWKAAGITPTGPNFASGPEGGVHRDEVGKPIPVGVTPPRPSEAAAEDAQLRAQDFAALERNQQKQIDDETDRRFWQKVGDQKHQLLGTGRNQQGMRELWMETRDEVLQERDRILTMPDKLRSFVAPDAGEPSPEDYKAALRIGEKARNFTDSDWARYERNVVRTTSDYAEAEEAIGKFAAKVADEQAIAKRVERTEMLFRGEHAQRAAHEPGYPEKQVEMWLPTTNFKTIEEYDAACDAYLQIFRDRAVEIAFLALRTSESVVRSELARYARPDERAALVRDLEKLRERHRYASQISYPEQGLAAERPQGTLSQEETAAWDAVDRERSLQAVIHPAVKDADLSLIDLVGESADELGEKIETISRDHLDAIAKSRARLVDNPEVVFQWDNVIRATKKEMGADNGAIREMIVDQHLQDIRRDHEIRALGMAVLAIGLSVLTFGTGAVAVVAATALLAQGVYMGVEEVKAYGDAYAAAHSAFDAGQSLSSASPSAFWAAFALISAGLDGINLVNALKAAAEPLSVLEATGSLKKFDASLLEVTEHLPDELKAALSPGAKAVLKRAMRAKAKLDVATGSFGRAFKAADAFGPRGLLSPKVADELSKCGYLGAQMGMQEFAEFAAYAQTGPLRQLNVSTLSPEEIDALKQAWAKGVREAEEKGVALAPSSLKAPGDPSGEPVPDTSTEPAPDPGAEPAPERVPVNAKYKSTAELRSAVEQAIDAKRLKTGTAEADLNPEWLKVRDNIATMPDTTENNWIKERIYKVFEGRRSRQVIIDEFVDIWKGAAADGLTTTEEIAKRAGRGKPLKLLPPRELPPEEFGIFLRERAPRIDTVFKNASHGAYTHVFDDLLVGRILGGADESLIFRRMLTDVTHPAADLANKPFWSQLWDALFDEYRGGHINTPEELGPILHDVLGIDLKPPKP
jgi:hypothetical protein